RHTRFSRDWSSDVCSSDLIHQYYTEGVGEDFYLETVDLDLIDRWEAVDDHQSFAMARRLAKVEGILTGPSGGMAVEGALRVAARSEERRVGQGGRPGRRAR